MLELGQLDLQLAFGALRALRKNVEDEARAIDDAAVEGALQIALLRTGKRVVEDDEVGAGGATQCGDLGDLAAAGKKRRVGFRAAGGDYARNFGPCRSRQRLELREPLCRLGIAEVEFDQQRAITAAGAIKHPGPRG